jgi:V/A-type H+-transporting ATPase subunit D
MESWIGLFATGEELLSGLVSVKAIRTSSANVAGVEIPVFDGIDTEVKPIDLWATPAWVDDAVAALTDILALQSERKILQRQRELITAELTTTSQRVNLFEKVKIPACRENIRVIKIALGDEQTAAVTRGKIAKARTPETDAEGGQAA